MFALLSRLVKKNQNIFLILIGILNIIALIGLFQIKINPSFDVFYPSDSQYKLAYDKMRTNYNAGEPITILFELNEPLFNVKGIKKLRKLNNLIQSIGINDIHLPIPDPVQTPHGMIPLKDITEDQIPYIKQYEARLGNFSAIREKNNTYFILYTLYPHTINYQSVKHITRILNKTDTKHYISGNSYMQYKMIDDIIFLLLTVPPLAIFLILLVFRWRLGSFKATFFSIAPAGISALWTMGFLSLLGVEFTILTILVPIFTIVLGSADGLHFVSTFLSIQDERETALDKTFARVGTSLVLTTITTVAGFLSLTAFNSKALSQMGLFSALGLVLAATATFLLLPALLLKTEVKYIQHKEDYITHLIFSTIRKKHSTVIILFSVLAFLPGIFFLKIGFSMDTMYKQHSEVNKSIKKINEVFNSAIPVFADFSFSDPLDKEHAQAIQNLERDLLTEGIAQKTISFYSLLAQINFLSSGNNEYSAQIARMLMENTRDQINLKYLIREYGTRVIIFPRDTSNTTLQTISRMVQNHDLGGKLTGIPYMIKEMNDTLLYKQILSILFAIALVFIMILLLNKSLTNAVFTLIPITATLVILFGFLGYTQIQLSIVTGIMASIAIGVGVDYAIHLTGLYAYHIRTMHTDKAMNKTLKEVSTPIVANSLGFAIGLSAYLISPFIIHSYLSIIMWVTMLWSAFLSLTVLPVLLKRRKRS